MNRSSSWLILVAVVPLLANCTNVPLRIYQEPNEIGDAAQITWSATWGKGYESEIAAFGVDGDLVFYSGPYKCADCDRAKSRKSVILSPGYHCMRIERQWSFPGNTHLTVFEFPAEIEGNKNYEIKAEWNGDDKYVRLMSGSDELVYLHHEYKWLGKDRFEVTHNQEPFRISGNYSAEGRSLHQVSNKVMPNCAIYATKIHGGWWWRSWFAER